MKRELVLAIVICLIVSTGCVKSTGTLPATTQPPTLDQPTISPTEPPPTPATSPMPLTLAEPGAYKVGIRRMVTYIDSKRDNREVSLTIWYPALVPEGTPAAKEYPDTELDTSAAPYPLIMSSSKVGFIFAQHLASHGFVVAGINRIDTYEFWNNELVKQPRDYLFALDSLASNPPEFIKGYFDPNRTGVMGYSFDGFNALALSGARVDPQFYFDFCDNADKIDPVAPEWWANHIMCNMRPNWAKFETAAGEEFTKGEDGLWFPMTDERIIAAMPMAPDGARLFGDRGLAAVDRPILIISAAEDELLIYDSETVFMYENIGAVEKTLISFVGKGHMMIYDEIPVAQMKHFATAFFGKYLQGKEDYAQYFSREYIQNFPEFKYGVEP